MKKLLPTLIGVAMFTAQAFSQNVGVGTNNPQTKLQVAGALSSIPVTAAAAATVTIPDNTSVFQLTATSGAQANVLSMATPHEGQFLTIYNSDDDPATFAGNTIAAATGIITLQYIGTGWRLTSETHGGSTGWSTSGNAGTVPGTNFIGTTDNQALDIRTNNVVHTQITTKGQIFEKNTGFSTFLGENAGNSDVATSQNASTYIGYGAGASDSWGENVFVGAHAAESATNVQQSVAIGNGALRYATTGHNTAVGYAASGANPLSGDENASFGYNALGNTSSGSYNTGLGANAGNVNSTGSNNTFIGRNANAIANSLSNATAIGANAVVAASNSLVLGDNVNVGIGTSTPGSKLEVAGTTKTTNFQMTSGAGANKVLQSDASGNATWVNPTSLSITETDPKVGTLTATKVPKWNGTTLADGLINDNGTGIGISQASPVSTLDVTGSYGTAITTTPITGVATLEATQSTILATPSSAYQITLPTLASSPRRVYTIIYNGAPGGNTITIKGNGSENISSAGSTANTLALTGGTVVLQNNGTNWYASTVAPSTGSGNYVQNNAVNSNFGAGQGASFDITGNSETGGNATFGGNVGIGTTSTANTLDVQGGNAGSATNGTNINLQAQNGGTGGTNGGNVNINSGTGGSANGSVAINVGNNGNVNIATSTSTGTVTLGGTAAQTVNIANDNTNTKTVNIGGTSVNSAVNIKAGATGGVTIGTLTGNTLVKSSGTGLLSNATATDLTNLANGAFIKNQTGQQTGSDFNISNTGTIGSTLTVGGLTTLNGGVTNTGAANINTSGNAVTNIGTSTGTGAVNLGNTTGGVSVKSLTTAGIVTNTAAGLLGTTAQVPVTNGGTGVGTLTAGGVLYGNGTGNVLVTPAPGSGQILVGNTTTPSFVTMNGDATITNTGLITINTGAGGFIKNQTTQQSPASFNVSGTGVVGAGGVARAGLGLTLSANNGTTYSANADVGDPARMFSIVNENATANSMSILSMRTNPGGGANNQMLDMKLVNPNDGTSKLIYSFGPNAAFTDRFTFTNTGNLGIGATSPNTQLQISTASAVNTMQDQLYLDNSRAYGSGAGNFGSALAFTTSENFGQTPSNRVLARLGARVNAEGTSAEGNMVFETRNAGTVTEKMRILYNGNVGIGTTLPGNNLHIAFNGASIYGCVLNIDQNVVGNSDGPKIQFRKLLTTGPTEKDWTAGILNGVGANSFAISEDASPALGFGTPRLTIAAGGGVTLSSLGTGLVKATSGLLSIATGSDVPSGSGNYIQNTTSQQASSNYNISGNGIIAGALTVGANAAANGRLEVDVPADKNDNPADNGIYVYNAGNAGDNDDAIIAARVNGAGAGDPFVSFDIAGVIGWSMGIDNSDGDKFKIGNSWADPASSTRLTIDGSGNVGIGTASPGQKLDVAGNISIPGSSGWSIYDWSAGDANWRIGMSDVNATVGFSRALATSHVQYASFASGAGQGFAVGDKVTGLSAFEVTGSGSGYNAYFRGNVGVGVSSTAEKLDVSGNIKASGTAYWGNGGTRTETRDDAGTQGGRSGDYETSAPSPAADWYSGASSWQHLLETRHSNTANNYAMQFAGSFFDQRLYFRKTNNSPSTAWREVVTIPQGAGGSDNQAWSMSANFSHSADDWCTGCNTTGYMNGSDANATFDDFTSVVTMPFSITINGVSSNLVSICSNGWIAFGNTSVVDHINSTLPYNGMGNLPVIFPYWDDLQDYGNGEWVRWGCVGSSPNQTFIIDYNMRIFNNGTSGDRVNFEVLIHEGSALINVKYRDVMAPNFNGQSATIGFQLNGGSSAKAYPIVCNGKVLDDNRDDSEGWSVSPVR